MKETEIRVRLSETDAFGVVYYGQYFIYFDVARLEMLRGVGVTERYLRSKGLGFVAAEASCRYLAPARFDDMLRARTWIERMGGSSVTYAHLIIREGDWRKIAKGRVVDVLVDRRGRPTKIPKDLRAKLSGHLRRGARPGTKS